MSTNIDTKISPSLHSDNVKSIDGYDADTESVLAPTARAFSEAYEGLRQVHEARNKAKTNPTWNEAQQVIATQDFADKVFAKVAKGFDSVHGDLDRGIAHLEAQLSGPVENKAAASISAEIRSYVKNLKTSERQAFIQRAIDEGDVASATAVLGAPAYLSGFDPKMQSVLLRMYHERQSPDAAKRLKAMQGAKALIQRNGALLHAELEKAVGAPPHKVNKLRQAKNASEQAFILKDVA